MASYSNVYTCPGDPALSSSSIRVLNSTSSPSPSVALNSSSISGTGSRPTLTFPTTSKNVTNGGAAHPRELVSLDLLEVALASSQLGPVQASSGPELVRASSAPARVCHLHSSSADLCPTTPGHDRARLLHRPHRPLCHPTISSQTQRPPPHPPFLRTSQLPTAPTAKRNVKSSANRDVSANSTAPQALPGSQTRATAWASPRQHPAKPSKL